MAAGADLVGIEPDVAALAKLIAARNIAPPLSIGLFGDWGSGKSFFMRQLQAQISQISTAARESNKLQKEIAFYKRIVQIDFNAWQYMEGNLWASLVDHIFRNLRVSGEGNTGELEELQKKLLENLQSTMEAEQEANARVLQAQDRLADAEKAFEEAHQRYTEASEELIKLSMKDITAIVFADEAVKGEIKDLSHKLGLSDIGESVLSLRSALRGAEVMIAQGNSLFTPMVRDPQGGRRLVYLVLVLIGTAVAALLLGYLASLSNNQAFTQLVTFIGSIAAFCIGAANWVRAQARWLSDRMVEVQRTRAHIEVLTEEKQLSNRGEIATIEEQLHAAKQELIAWEQAKREAAERVSQAKAEYERTTPARLMSDFIQRRVESSDYTKHLGILAMIREDFKALSNFIDNENAKLLTAFAEIEAEQEDESSRINRIVLYIDDLDRCSPSRVIEVLQAVHLLLGLSLFVVVVAVDVRWVEYSLRLAYGRLLGGDSSDDKMAASGDGLPSTGGALPPSALPINYLEKIFQIPFWVAPLATEDRRQLLRGLLSQEMRINSADTDLPLPPGNGALAAEIASTDTSPPPQEETTVDLDPGALIIHSEELTFMEELSPILGRSPRAVKRFVNIYRLIKASLREDEQELFVQEGSTSGEYKVVLLLLALITNVPTVGLEVFRAGMVAIQEARSSTLLPVQISFADDVVPRVAGNSKAQASADLEKVLTWMSEHSADLVIDAYRLHTWIRRAARYSFALEPESFET
jgi:hypothetical protein